MKLADEKHFAILIYLTFIACFLTGIAGGIAKSLSGSLFVASNIWQVANMFYVVGCAMLSLKATGEGRNVSAAGFILLSIGMGTFYSLQTNDHTRCRSSIYQRRTYPHPRLMAIMINFRNGFVL